MALPDNPNEYNDDEFTRWSNELHEAVGGLWEAGASYVEIIEATENALENQV